jgi:tetratricopeptide (TPR) repeat protein
MLGIGCGAMVLGSLLTLGGGYWWWSARAERLAAEALAAQEAKAAEAFDPVLGKLEAEGPTYDLDRTIRIIHSVDVALREHDDFEDYLRYMAQQDYRDVAPEVLEARKELLEVLQPLYAKQTELEDQQAMWEMTSELMLATLSVVSVSGDVDLVAPSGEFSVDREQARTLWRDLKDRQAEKRELQRDIDALEEDLVEALVSYADVYYEYVDQWDQLSILRDRAYLAVHNGDWAAARAAASAAVQMAPKEREAHLLLALAMIEEGNPEDLAEARRLLEQTIEEHPDRTAPALLLMGAVDAREGRTEQARLAYQQAAAYYPKQADALLDMLDPYKMRTFLKQSREGGFILEQYKATMLGSGYFSPDLQLAKLLFDAGDFHGGKAKVLDHFARRRNQEQWDFILSDITFCQELLGPDFWQIFPEDSYLDLEVSKTMLGSSLNLSVDNRSPKTLRNATLVLALHFTDMYPGMYEALPAPQTVPAVPAHESTSFGTLDIELDIAGKPKTVDDIVQHRAILVTNDAVLWVDTDEFKLAEAEAREQARQTPTVGKSKATTAPSPVAARHPEFLQTREAIVAGLSQGLDLHIEQKYGADNVLIELPRELSILRPVFRLQYGDQVFTATDNLIDGDRIELRFAGVENFDDAAATEDLELVVGSPFGDLVLTWNAAGQLTWDYAGVAAGPSQ